MDVATAVLGILGGTGDQGRGLARRYAMAGHRVLIGSRDAARAEAAAASVRGSTGPVEGRANRDAAAEADIVVVAVPWEGHGALLDSLADVLAGKIVVDCVNPIGFDKAGPFALRPEEGSAAEQAARRLPDSRVVAAFHHVSAVLLLDPDIAEVDTDVLVLGDDAEAVDAVLALVERVPAMRGVYAGRLRGAHQVEALTANIIAINKRYRAHAGLRVTDLPRP